MKQLNELVAYPLFTIIVGGISVGLIHFFGFAEKEATTVAAAIVLLVAIIIFATIKVIDNANEIDISISKSINHVVTLLIYDSEHNDMNFIAKLRDSNSGDFLQFFTFDMANDDKELLNDKLDKSGCILCMWNTTLKEDDALMVKIEKHLKLFGGKPFILVAENKGDYESKPISKYKTQYKVIKKEEPNVLVLLLSRSVGRITHYIKYTSAWKNAFIMSLFLVLGSSLIFLGLLFSKNIPKENNNQIYPNNFDVKTEEFIFEKDSLEKPIAIKRYIELKAMQLKHLLNDESIKISVWRKIDTHNIKCYIKTDGQIKEPNALHIDSTFTKDCINYNFVYWSAFENSVHIENYGTGKIVSKIAKRVKAVGNNEEKSSIAFGSFKANGQSETIICIDSNKDNKLYDDNKSIKVAKMYLYELITILSHIPDRELPGIVRN